LYPFDFAVGTLVADFSRICSLVESEQMRDARLGGLPRHPPRRARNPNSELFSKHALTLFLWLFDLDHAS
jgi:hypothetical protein